MKLRRPSSSRRPRAGLKIRAPCGAGRACGFVLTVPESRSAGPPETVRHRRRRDSVDRIDPADAIGHTDRADTANAGIGICSEAGTVFTCGSDMANRRGFEQLVETQHVVARDAEDVANPQLV